MLGSFPVNDQGETLIEALVPFEGYDPESYKLQGATATLPGHSPGGIGLFEESSGVLFGADTIYDGPLIFEGPGMSVAAYRMSFDLLKTLPVTTVHGGHDPSFDQIRMLEIIAEYEAIWDQIS